MINSEYPGLRRRIVNANAQQARPAQDQQEQEQQQQRRRRRPLHQAHHPRHRHHHHHHHHQQNNNTTIAAATPTTRRTTPTANLSNSTRRRTTTLKASHIYVILSFTLALVAILGAGPTDTHDVVPFNGAKQETNLDSIPTTTSTTSSTTTTSTTSTSTATATTSASNNDNNTEDRSQESSNEELQSTNDTNTSSSKKSPSILSKEYRNEPLSRRLYIVLLPFVGEKKATFISTTVEYLFPSNKQQQQPHESEDKQKQEQQPKQQQNNQVEINVGNILKWILTDNASIFLENSDEKDTNKKDRALEIEKQKMQAQVEEEKPSIAPTTIHPLRRFLYQIIDPGFLEPSSFDITLVIDKILKSTPRLFAIANVFFAITFLIHAGVAKVFLGTELHGEEPWSRIERVGGFLIFKYLLVAAVLKPSDMVDSLILLSWYTLIGFFRSLAHLASSSTSHSIQSGQPPKAGVLNLLMAVLFLLQDAWRCFIRRESMKLFF